MFEKILNIKVVKQKSQPLNKSVTFKKNKVVNYFRISGRQSRNIRRVSNAQFQFLRSWPLSSGQRDEFHTPTLAGGVGHGSPQYLGTRAWLYRCLFKVYVYLTHINSLVGETRIVK